MHQWEQQPPNTQQHPHGPPMDEGKPKADKE